MPYSPETTAAIAQWRQQLADPNLTPEEEKRITQAAIIALRSDRVGAHHASTTSRTKKAAAAAPVNTQALLAGFLGQGTPAADISIADREGS